MNPLINEVLSEIKDEFGISKSEAERVLDSQFKMLELCLRSKDLRTINFIHLGKVKPSKWLEDNYELVKKIQTDIRGVEEPLNE